MKKLLSLIVCMMILGIAGCMDVDLSQEQNDYGNPNVPEKPEEDEDEEDE